MTPKYILNLYGKGALGEIKYKLTDLPSLPNVHAGDYIFLRDFDRQYENQDRAIVTETTWAFQGDAEHPVINLSVHFRELTNEEESERRSRNS